MNKRLKKTSDNVLLAGLGALAVAEQEGNDLFQQLVEKGREFAVTRSKKASAGKDELLDIEVFGFRLKIKAPKPTGRIPVPSSPLSGTRRLPREGQKRSKPMDPEAVAARQAKRLARARRAILKEFGSLDAPVDSEHLQREHKIFSVIHRNTAYVPSFQFDDRGHPRPAVAGVIRALGEKTSDWGLALWFTAANGSLNGKRPVDLLKDEPERVVQAAEEEAEELVF